MHTRKEELKKFIDMLEKLITEARGVDDPDYETSIIQQGVKKLIKMTGYRVFRDETGIELSESDVLSVLEEHLGKAKEVYKKMI